MMSTPDLHPNDGHVSRQPKPESLADFGQNLRQCRHAIGWTLDQLAAATGISKPYLSNIETGRLCGPPAPDKLALLEKALNLPAGVLTDKADWLRTPQTVRNLLSARPLPENLQPTIAPHGDSVPRRADGAVDLDQLLKFSRPIGPFLAGPCAESGTPNSTESSVVPLLRIPLINRVAAGNAAEFTDLDYPAGIADSYIAAPVPTETVTESGATSASGSPDAGLFALRIEGDSMEPRYQQGDIVVFSSTQAPQDGDDCLVRLDDSENFSTTFKRIEFSAGSAEAIPDADATYLTLVPLNPVYPRRSLRQSQISGLYPAVWRIRPANSRNALPEGVADQSFKIQSNASQTALPPREDAAGSVRRRRGRKPPRESTPPPVPADGATQPQPIVTGTKAEWTSNRFSLEND